MAPNIALNITVTSLEMADYVLQKLNLLSCHTETLAPDAIQTCPAVQQSTPVVAQALNCTIDDLLQKTDHQVS